MRMTDNIDFCNFIVILVSGSVISFTVYFPYCDALAILLGSCVLPQTLEEACAHLQKTKIIVKSILSP